MVVKFGVLIMPESVTGAAGLAKLAEEHGFDRVRLGDSQSVYRELYVCLGLAAAATSRVRIGPGVTNPLTRHPAVTASAIASVDEVSYGRAFLGLGAGDSAVYNLGLKGAPIAAIAEYVTAVRELLTQGRTTYQGRACHLMWARRRVPIYIAGHGPKALRLAGRLGDGVIIGLGLTPEAIAAAKEAIAHGAAESGRRLEDLDLWWWCVANIGSSRDEATYEMRMSLATAGVLLARSTFEGKKVPAPYQEPLRTLYREYVVQEHVLPGVERKNARLISELGLTDYLAERYALAGTPEDCIRRVEEVASRGANQLWLSTHVADKGGFIRLWGSQVIPRFAS